jgi:hypothetical protein
MKKRRERFSQSKKQMSDVAFLRDVAIEEPLAAAVAVSIRRTIAVACGLDYQLLYPCDSLRELAGLMDWGHPLLAWLNVDYPELDVVAFSVQFMQEFARTTGREWPALEKAGWEDKLPSFAGRRRSLIFGAVVEQPTFLGEWTQRSVQVIGGSLGSGRR